MIEIGFAFTVTAVLIVVNRSVCERLRGFPITSMAEAARQRREPLQARSRETVERILAAARELILEGGVDAATTTAIAARAGVGASSLYRFFADRDELFARLLEVEIEQIERTAEAAEAEWRALVDPRLRGTHA